MSTGPKKKENRGGARAGAGRKGSMTLSQRQIKLMIRKANAYKKEYGKEVDEILLDFIYGVPQIIKVPEHDMLIPIKDDDGNIVGKGMETVPEHDLVDIPRIRERQAAIKIFKDFTMAKLEEGGKADQALGGPGLYLPETDPDPAGKVVPINQAAEE